MLWSHEPISEWQTAERVEQLRGQLHPNAFLQMIENRWVSLESSFVEMEWWDASTDADARPLLADPSWDVSIGGGRFGQARPYSHRCLHI
jgi:hypothetical protein